LELSSQLSGYLESNQYWRTVISVSTEERSDPWVHSRLETYHYKCGGRKFVVVGPRDNCTGVNAFKKRERFSRVKETLRNGLVLFGEWVHLGAQEAGYDGHNLGN
jgi:hypothetical protein